MPNSFAVIDIHPRSDGTLPADIIKLAYLASRRAKITLLLDDVSPFDIDRLLDTLVAKCRLDIPGLAYVHHALSDDGDAQGNKLRGPCDKNCDPVTQSPSAVHGLLRRLARPTRLDEAFEA